MTRHRGWLATATLILFALLAQAASAETVEVAPGVRVTKKTYYAAPLNEQPFYGFARKTPAQHQADERFVTDILQSTGSREKAYEGVAGRAWSAYFAGDIATAGRRFNQAYLIAPERSGVYHAFAVIIQTRFNDSDYADELFRIALKQPDPSKRLNADYGRFLLLMKRPRDAQPVLEQAVVDSPDFATVWLNLGHARQQNGNDAGACAAAAEAGRHTPVADVQAELEILKRLAKCD